MSESTRTADIARILDLDRYPVDELTNPRRRSLVAFCRAALAFEGACQLPGFVREGAIDALVAEATSMAPQAFRTDDTHNVYFEQVDADDDVSSALQHSSKSAIGWDRIGADSPLRIAYEWDALTTFLGEALGLPELFRYADPQGAASLMVFEPGDELGWHFDRSPFAVTLMLQPAPRGGAFQYHHQLRGPDDERRADVAAALRDELAGRITLPNEPGTLSLFRGQYSMHRVTPVEGAQRRINAVLAYSVRPGDELNALTRELFYGRAV